MKTTYLPKLVLWTLAASTCAGAPAEKSLVVVVNSGDATATIYSLRRIGTGDSTLSPVKTVPTGKGPNEVCLSPDGARAYVSNRGETSITAIDLDAGTVAATIGDAAIKNPDGCLVSWDGAKLYVAAAGGHSVFVFDTKDAHKLSQIEVGDEPRRLLFSADGSKLYVSKGSDPYVSVVDVRTEKVVGKIRAGRDARPMAWMPDGKYLAIANVSDDTVEFVKPGETQPEYVVGVPKSPQRLVVVPSKQILFAIGRVDGVLSLLDIRPDSQEYGRVMATIAVGKAPWGLALSAAGDSLYVTNTADNTVSIVDLRLMRTTFSVPTGKAPLGLAVR